MFQTIVYIKYLTYLCSVFKQQELTLKIMNNQYFIDIDGCGYAGLFLTKEIAQMCYHSGSCDEDIDNCMELPYFKEQFATISDERLIKSLCEVYDDPDVIRNSTRLDNEKRALWIAAGNFLDEVA